jgi:hypothetical protein
MRTQNGGAFGRSDHGAADHTLPDWHKPMVIGQTPDR